MWRDCLARSIREIRGTFEDIYFDTKLGIDTTSLKYNRERIENGNSSVPTSYNQLRAIFKKVKFSLDDVFCDVGCGTGRVICYVADTRKKVKAIVGVEINPKIAKKAEENCWSFPQVSVWQGDILNFDLSQITVFYLYNPFDTATLTKFLEKLKSPVRIIYTTPVYAYLLDKKGWRREFEIKGTIVWRK